MSRKGFALVGALIAVILLGALIVGAFVATTEETRVSGNIRTSAYALSAAESVIESDLTGWAQIETDSVSVGQRVTHSASTDGLSVTATLIRLDSSVYWIVGEAGEPNPTSPTSASVRRRISVLLRRVPDSVGKARLVRLEERAWSELF